VLLDKPDVISTQEPLDLTRNQRGEEVREEFAKRLDQVKNDNPSLDKLKSELEAAALRDTTTNEEAAALRDAKAASLLSLPVTASALANLQPAAKPLALTSSTTASTSDAKYDQLMSMFTKQCEEFASFRLQMERQVAGSSSAPRPSASNPDDGRKGLKSQYKSSSGYTSEDDDFVENYSMLLPGHEERNKRITRGAGKLQDIGNEELAALKSVRDESHILALDGTRISIQTELNESPTKVGSYQQYSYWLERLIIHLQPE
jgi:hypothetical protein